MKILLKVFAALLISLLLWEVILENCVLKTNGSAVHPVLGTIYKQGYHLHATEGYSQTSINSYGMRGPEIAAKKTGEFRILVVGDSYTEAFQVTDDNTYSALLQAKLKNRCSEITVINAGRSGASPANYIHLADFYQSTINPDFVIIQLNDGDFVQDIFNKANHFYVVQENGTFKTEAKPNRPHRIVEKIPQLKPLVKLSILQIGMEKTQNLLKDTPKINNLEAAQPAFRPNYSEIIDWSLAELKNKYPNSMILYLPIVSYDNQVKPKSEVETWVEYYADKHSLPFINMRAFFLNYYAETLQPAHGFYNTMPGKGHVNEAGHRIIASQLDDYITKEVLK